MIAILSIKIFPRLENYLKIKVSKTEKLKSVRKVLESFPPCKIQPSTKSKALYTLRRKSPSGV